VADDERIAQARKIVADFNGYGYNMRNSAATWGSAVVGILAIPVGLLLCVPATAHAFGEPHPQPIALLGSLFFGTIGYFAVKRIRRYNEAKRFLAAHAGG
jgi:hypothetical protein